MHYVIMSSYSQRIRGSTGIASMSRQNEIEAIPVLRSMSFREELLAIRLLASKTMKMGTLVIERAKIKQGAFDMSVSTIRADVDKIDGVTESAGTL